MNPHWRVQYHNIFCDVIKYDHFLRFENLEEELAAIMSRYGKKQAEIRSVHKNQSNAGSKLGSYYTPEIAQDGARQVRDRFRVFRLFHGAAGLSPETASRQRMTV